MDRRRFFSMAAGAGVGVLLPLTAYRYMMKGMHTGYADVRAYLLSRRAELTAQH